MPELPEVESVRRTLDPRLLGRRVASVQVNRPEVVEGDAGPAALLAGERIRELRRRGKQLAIVAEGGKVLVVHLGMTGQLMMASPDRAQSSTHVHVLWTLDPPASGRATGRTNDDVLIFRDPRRFGGLWPLASVADLEQRWADLGPDALTITTGQLRKGLGKSRRAIKAALLDQRVLAGVGNIYADEALFAAGIAPARLASRLSPGDLDRLAAALRATLRASITAGGSTLRDFVDGQGKPGSYRTRHAVYGRAGKPCLKCKKPLRSGILGQRTTVWCSNCQRKTAVPRSSRAR